MTISINLIDREKNKFSDIRGIPHVNITTTASVGTPTTILDGVTSTGASDAFDISKYTKSTFHIISSLITDGGTIKLQHSLDGTNYYDFAEKSITANGVTEIIVENQIYRYVRANLTARTDGTYTVLMLVGN